MTVMPRQCTVCTHEDKAGIDSALLGGGTLRNVAGQFSDVSISALDRHRKNHLAPSILAAQEVAEVAHADTLLEQVREYQSRVDRLVDKAEAGGDLRTALSGLRETRGYLELLAKLAGELDERPQVNVMFDQRAQQVILEALEPYNAAKYAVARALGELRDAEAPEVGEPRPNSTRPRPALHRGASTYVDKGNGSW